MKNLIRCLRLFALFAGLYLQSVPYSVAASLDDAARDAATIVRQQQESQKALGEELRLRRKPAPDFSGIQKPGSDHFVQSDECHRIDKVEVEGVTLFWESEIEKITRKFSGQCLDLQDINSILRLITNIYFDAGYITSRPYIKPQDLSDHILVVTVIEGKIGRISYKNMNLNEDFSRQFSFPTTAGKILNIRDLEQGLEHLNRLQSNSVKLSLVPGAKPGDTEIILENTVSKRSNIALVIDNNGAESTGEIQCHVSLGYDNLAGLADYFGLTISHDAHRNSGKDSRNFFARYEVPFGWNLFALRYGHFDYKQTIEGVSQTFPATGTTRNLSLSAYRVLHRDRNRKLTTGLLLDWKDEKNAILDVLLDTSSQNFVVGRGSINLDHYFDQAALSMSVSFHRGLDILGVQDDSYSPDDSPQAQFSKWTADISLKSSFDYMVAMNHELFIHGQYSDDKLFASEQLGVGSLYTVRGYKSDGFSGNRGGYIRNDLILPLATGTSLRKANISRLEPYIGFDWGSVKVIGTDEENFESLQSWTVGIKAWDAQQTIKVSYSRPINMPQSFDRSNGEFFLSFSRYF